MKISVPCTSANLGVLFDKGGVALEAYRNEISVVKSDEERISVHGTGTDEIPSDKNNLVYRAITKFYDETGIKKSNFILSMNNSIPLSRGLGSSAACIAGGMFAANIFEGSPLTESDVINLAALMEGHGDNVCAAAMGGITLFDDGSISQIHADKDLAFIIYIPEGRLSTEKSRAALPSRYPDEIISKSRRLEKDMISALSSYDYEKAGRLMMQDVIHQPYRRKFIPHWDEVMEKSAKAGVYGTALSGAGPTMISMCGKGSIESILQNLRKSIDIRYGLNIMGCEINETGICIVGGGFNEQQGKNSIDA